MTILQILTMIFLALSAIFLGLSVWNIHRANKILKKLK